MGETGFSAGITDRSAVFKLFSGKDEALLIRRDAFLVLNLALHIVDSIR